MTYKEWESGKRLTIENATKEQLKIMCKDLENTIKDIHRELRSKNQSFEELSNLFVFVCEEIGQEKIAEISKKYNEKRNF